MWSILLRILIAVVSISLWTAMLAGLGVVINKIVIWQWLTDFFAILQRFMLVFNFMWDVPVTISIIGWIMLIDITYWVFLAGLIVIRRFNKV